MPIWRKSSFSGNSGCLEVAEVGAAVLLRDSKTPETVITLTAADWSAFVAGVRAGEFTTEPLGDDEDMTPEEFDRRFAAGEPVEIAPGPRPVLTMATLPDWAAEASVWRADTLEWAEAYDPDPRSDA